MADKIDETDIYKRFLLRRIERLKELEEKERAQGVQDALDLLVTNQMQVEIDDETLDASVDDMLTDVVASAMPEMKRQFDRYISDAMVNLRDGLDEVATEVMVDITPRMKKRMLELVEPGAHKMPGKVLDSEHPGSGSFGIGSVHIQFRTLAGRIHVHVKNGDKTLFNADMQDLSDA